MENKKNENKKSTVEFLKSRSLFLVLFLITLMIASFFHFSGKDLFTSSLTVQITATVGPQSSESSGTSSGGGGGGGGGYYKPIDKKIPDVTEEVPVISVPDDMVNDTSPIPDETPIDRTPPANVRYFTAIPVEAGIKLTWENPSDPDFYKTRIEKSTIGYVSDNSTQTAIYDGNGNEFIDYAVDVDIQYFYTAFAYDVSGNHASGAIASGIVKNDDNEVTSDNESMTPTTVIGQEPSLPDVTEPTEINITPSETTTTVSPNQPVTYKIYAEILKDGVESVILSLNGSEYIMEFDPINNVYTLTMSAPDTAGLYYGYFTIKYLNGKTEKLPITLTVEIKTEETGVEETGIEETPLEISYTAKPVIPRVAFYVFILALVSLFYSWNSTHNKRHRL